MISPIQRTEPITEVKGIHYSSQITYCDYQIARLRRELPPLVAAKKMLLVDADFEIMTMQAIRETLELAFGVHKTQTGGTR